MNAEVQRQVAIHLLKLVVKMLEQAGLQECAMMALGLLSAVEQAPALAAAEVRHG